MNNEASEIHNDQFGAYLELHEPQLWGSILAEELENAAVWSWSLQEVKNLVFLGQPSGHIPSHLDVITADFHMVDAWAGLPPDRLLVEIEGWFDGDVPLGHDGDLLALDLNMAIAAWAGREFEPHSILESHTYCRKLVLEAACEGNIQEMREAVKKYGVDYASNHAPAFETAAARNDVEFARALIDEIGANVTLYTMMSACSDKEAPTAALRDAVAVALEAGIPCPDWALDTIRAWAKTDARFTVILL